MSDNKYKLFRNYMVNELGISRDDIKEWTMEAIKESVEKILRGYNVKDRVEYIADRVVRDNITNVHTQKEIVTAAIEKILRDTVKIYFEKKEI
jgi:hypothetical protein